jgi:hypothetical protein
MCVVFLGRPYQNLVISVGVSEYTPFFPFLQKYYKEKQKEKRISTIV